MKTLLTIILTLAVFVLLFFAFVWSGSYNIAATDHHNALTLWVLDVALNRSVEHHAASLQAPANMQDSTTIRTGAYHYHAMCRGCHGAPGIKRSGGARPAMYPEPPQLSKDNGGWTAPQFFWIIKNGIKMSGMPAYAGVHEDDELWAIAAFMTKLPKLSPEQYQSLSAETDSTGHEHHE